MAVPSFLAHTAEPAQEVPVKNTFIHFSESETLQLVRHSSSPPRFSFPEEKEPLSEASTDDETDSEREQRCHIVAAKAVQAVQAQPQAVCKSKKAKARAKAAAASAHVAAGTVQEDALTWKMEVGIAEDAEFRVCKRLIGPGGKNMKSIVSQAGGKAAKVSVNLRGHGAVPTDDLDAEIKEPLVMLVSASQHEAFNLAVQLTEALVHQIHEEHREFMATASL